MYEGGPVVIVEGNMDVINLWQCGIRSPMAIFGSEPSEGQVEMLGALGVPVFIMGDGDRAGRKTNELFVAMAKSAGYDVSVISVPDGMDPGDLPRDLLVDIMHESLISG